MANTTVNAELEQGLIITDPEDMPNVFQSDNRGVPRVFPYDGKNVMPTNGGMQSFFGEGSKIGTTDPGFVNLQEVLTYRTIGGNIFFLALAEDGCYIKSLEADGAPTVTEITATITVDFVNDSGCEWTKIFFSPYDSPSPWRLWTYAIIKNSLYLYQKGMDYIAEVTGDVRGTVIINKLSPTFIISTAEIYKYTIDLNRELGNSTYHEVTIFGAKYRATSTFHEDIYNIGTRLARVIALDAGFGSSVVAGTETVNITPEIYTLIANVDPTLTHNGTDASHLTLSTVLGNVPREGTATGVGDTTYSYIEQYIEFYQAGYWEFIYDGVTYSHTVGTDTVDVEQAAWNAFLNTLPSSILYEYIDSASYKDRTIMNIYFPYVDGVDAYTKISDTGGIFEENSGTRSNIPTDPVISYDSRLRLYTDPATGNSIRLATYDFDVSYTTLLGDTKEDVITALEGLINAASSTYTATDSGSGRLDIAKTDLYDPILMSTPMLSIYEANFGNGGMFYDYNTPTYNSLENANTLTFTGYKYPGLSHFALNTSYEDTIPYGSTSDAMMDLVKAQVLVMDPLSTGGSTQSAYSDFNGDITVSVTSIDAVDPSLAIANDGTEVNTITASSSGTIKLANVEGICAARGRLMAWDYLNSVYISSNANVVDFLPAIETQANVLVVDSLRGQIVKAMPTADGFFIYATGNVIKSTYVGGQFVFKYKEASSYGCVDPRHIANTGDITFHWSSNGLIAMDNEASEGKFAAKELTNWITRFQLPVKLSFISNRYLVISLQDELPRLNTHRARSNNTDTQAVGTGSALAISTADAFFDPVSWTESLYPEFKQAFVFDSYLGKWGQAELDFKAFFSLSPINQSAHKPEADYVLGADAHGTDWKGIGAFLPDGTVKLMTNDPTDSFLAIGKFQLSKSGVTMLNKAIIGFKDYPDCIATAELSMDGRTIDFSLDVDSATITTPEEDFYLTSVAKWFNIVLKGKFNLTYLELEGYKHANR